MMMEGNSKTTGSSFLALLGNLNPPEIYCELRKYLLSENDLKKNGFPPNSIGNPGLRKSTERKCCRCKSVFKILPDGKYVSDTICCFHTKKKLNNCVFPCCGRFDFSEGCATWPYHVFAKNLFQNDKFISTRNNQYISTALFGMVFAVDCEMSYTTNGLELTKIGVLNVRGEKVFESFVRPKNPILDYNTMYSGVTENDLKDITTTLEDVQEYLMKIIHKDSILVGHSLESDLKALRLIHDNVVDTSVVFPHEKFPGKYKMSLKSLALKYLNKDIQFSYGHDCIEDARTCLELMFYKIYSDLQTKPPPLVIKETAKRRDVSMPCSSKYETIHYFHYTDPKETTKRRDISMPCSSKYETIHYFHYTDPKETAERRDVSMPCSSKYETIHYFHYTDPKETVERRDVSMPCSSKYETIHYFHYTDPKETAERRDVSMPCSSKFETIYYFHYTDPKETAERRNVSMPCSSKYETIHYFYYTDPKCMSTESVIHEFEKLDDYNSVYVFSFEDDLPSSGFYGESSAFFGTSSGCY